MFTRWKTGVNGLSNGERLRVLDAEQKAKHMAVEFNCAERCVEHPIGLADCTDIDVSWTRMRWVRKRGRILVHIMVRLTPDERMFEVKWRLPDDQRHPKPKVKV